MYSKKIINIGSKKGILPNYVLYKIAAFKTGHLLKLKLNYYYLFPLLTHF